MAKNAAVAQIRNANLLVLAARKLGYFWFSFDQLFRTQALSRHNFSVRVVGVIVYWFLLILGVAGWCRLRSRNPDAALLFAAYAVVVTAMHLPFVMNTRIRAPLLEPALVILVGLALGAIAGPKAESAQKGRTVEVRKVIEICPSTLALNPAVDRRGPYYA